MQISSSRQSSKKNIVDMLIEIGYSKSKAENLYKKYKDWSKLRTRRVAQKNMLIWRCSTKMKINFLLTHTLNLRKLNCNMSICFMRKLCVLSKIGKPKETKRLPQWSKFIRGSMKSKLTTLHEFV